MELEQIKCNICGKDDTVLVCRSRDKVWLIGPGFDLVKCRACGLVYVNPRPAAGSIGEFYPDNYYPRPAGAVEIDSSVKNELRKISQTRYRMFERFKTRGRALEIGCGDGYFLDFLRDKGWQVSGVEMSALAARYGQKSLGLEIFNGKFDDYFGQAGAFDVICLYEVLEHLHDPTAALKKMKGLLKDDGLIIFSVPNYNSLMRPVYGASWYFLDVPRHLYQFTARSLRQMAEKCGLTPLVLESSSVINHSCLTAGYSESMRWWLRDIGLYPTRKIETKPAPLRQEVTSANKIKKIFHSAEHIFYYPLAWLMDKTGYGEGLHVCLARTK